MKKLILTCILLLVLFSGVYMYVSSSHTPYYSSVNAYIKENNTFYDFYDIDYYLDQGRHIKLSDMNKLKIYYNNDPKDNYNITLDKQDYQITYKMETIVFNEDEVKGLTKTVNNYPIYIESNDYSIDVSYFLDNGKQLSVHINKTNQHYDYSTMQDILIQLLEDSIDLNDID